MYNCLTKWERELFDITSWKFFKKDEFNEYIIFDNLFLIYVLALDDGYQGDIFIFPIRTFNEIINQSIVTSSKKGELRKLYISRSDNKWYARMHAIINKKIISEETCIDVSTYRRNFKLLE